MVGGHGQDVDAPAGDPVPREVGFGATQTPVPRAELLATDDDDVEVEGAGAVHAISALRQLVEQLGLHGRAPREHAGGPPERPPPDPAEGLAAFARANNVSRKTS